MSRAAWAHGLDDAALIEALLVALTLNDRRSTSVLLRHVQRRGLVERAQLRAEQQTRENSRRLGAGTTREEHPMTPTKTTNMKTAPFTDDELKTIHSAARGVWDEIGYDALQAVAEQRGKSINAVTMPRSHVLELVCDADRLSDRLRGDLRKRWDALDYADMLRLLKPAFSFARYGMALVLALLSLSLVACSSSSPASPGVRVEQADYGDAWPFTVDAGVLHCQRGAFVTLEHNRIHYALNGAAKQAIKQQPTLGYRDSADVVKPGVSLRPMLDRAQSLCEAK